MLVEAGGERDDSSVSRCIRRLVCGRGGWMRRRLKRGRGGRRRRDKGSSPGSDEVMTATSVAGGEMGSKEAETYEFVEGFHADDEGSFPCCTQTVRPTASIIRWAATTKSNPRWRIYHIKFMHYLMC